MSKDNAYNAEVASAAAQLNRDQTAVNEALVQKILQCERAEAALRASEDKLHALLSHQLSTREDERRRIALQIHDTLGQNLLALRLDLTALHQQTGERDWTGAALANLDGTLASVRQLIADLRPFQLELGLQAALDWEINQFQRHHKVACTVTGMSALVDVAIDDAQLLTLYRVVHECLDNIARHAAASEVGITVAIARKKLTVRIRDDGVGIDPAHPPTPAYGLLCMRERLLHAGGAFTLAPALPSGTIVTVTIPLCARK